jgi:uncharacterized protein (DUF305 family)
MRFPRARKVGGGSEMRPPPRLRRCVMLGISAALLLPLAGCGGASDEAGGVSETDIQFASAVTQHHAQTLQLLNLPQSLRMPDNAVEWTDPSRAERMSEIDDLTVMLESWDAEVPTTGLDHASEGDHVEFDASIDGILAERAVEEVRRAKGDAFADVWFAALLAHERGAVDLAQEQVSRGSDAGAVRFAEQDIDRHNALIATLERLADS